VKFGPKKKKSAHGLYALNSLRAPGREAARETENGPRPARPQTTLRVPGRHAAQDKKWSTGPLALGASRAPGRNLGLGRESLIPPGLNLGPVIVSHPSQSDGCTRFPAEQNRTRRPRANPSLILSLPHSLSRAAASDSERPTSGGGESMPKVPPEPLTGVRAHRWVNAPPSSGLSGASTRSLALTRWRASAPSRSHRRRRSTRGAPARSRARPHADERWSARRRGKASALLLPLFFFLLLLPRPRISRLARLWYQM
jgi:hypothetical protein